MCGAGAARYRGGMELTRTRALLPRVIWRDSSRSTNAELRELVTGQGLATGQGGGSALPHGTLLATTEQTAGRGRLGRGWTMPQDTAVAASLLIRGFGTPDPDRPTFSAGGLGDPPLGPGWLPLIAGSAATFALQPLFAASGEGGEPLRVGVKWPNDVHVRDEDDATAGRPGLKLCGILCEMLPDGSIIVGTGFNLLLSEADLPTERATSLLARGADVAGAETLADDAGKDLADRVLAAYAGELLRLVDLAGRDPGAVRARVARHSLTVGNEVRVHLPGGEIVDGRARELAEDGALVVDLPTGGRLTVSAGDVEHLR